MSFRRKDLGLKGEKGRTGLQGRSKGRSLSTGAGRRGREEPGPLGRGPRKGLGPQVMEEGRVEAGSSKMNGRAEPVPAQGGCATWHAPQVRQLQEGAAQLRTVYAGEHAEAIASREQEVLQGWKELLAACEDARLHVSSTADALRFHSQARDLLSWMDGIAGQIGAADKPRCPLPYLGLFACLWWSSIAAQTSNSPFT